MALVALRDKLLLTEEEALDAAWRRICERNPFPATLGRICPHPCEANCNRREKDEPVAIAAFERFVGEWGISRQLALRRAPDVRASGRRIAVVGSGPGGLACAYHLARRGHGVEVFEAFPHPGGMLRYGVPSYRLARGILDAEIGRLSRLDISIRTNHRVGAESQLSDLKATHDAVFVAIGAHLGRSLAVPGADGVDVLTGVEFLRRTSMSESVFIGPRVVVVGDGSTAIDVARVANRLGRATGAPGTFVTLVRAARELDDELRELETEGITVRLEATPVAVERDRAGRLAGVRIARARLSTTGPVSLRLPEVTGDERETVPADTVIAALSQSPVWRDLDLMSPTGEVTIDEWGKTKVAGVWSGGDDIALGSVANAIHQGWRAARSIDAALSGTTVADVPHRQPVSTGRVKLDLVEPRPRVSPHRLSSNDSIAFAAEIDQGVTREQAAAEAARCLGCGACGGCGRCWMFCTPGCFNRVQKPSAGSPFFTVNLAICDGCRKCADVCPTGFIEMH
jgi:NADPH-dependent glutamate synthase beta subunit-like oxidoreductase